MDLFYFPCGARSPWAVVSRMREIESLMRFQLVQTEADRVLVRCQSASAERRADSDRIAELVRSAFGAEIRVAVEETDQFPRLPSGKFAPALRLCEAPLRDG
jgi:hypothetical protein